MPTLPNEVLEEGVSVMMLPRVRMTLKTTKTKRQEPSRAIPTKNNLLLPKHGNALNNENHENHENHCYQRGLMWPCFESSNGMGLMGVIGTARRGERRPFVAEVGFGCGNDPIVASGLLCFSGTLERAH
jgi:hypothetical protein